MAGKPTKIQVLLHCLSIFYKFACNFNTVSAKAKNNSKEALEVDVILSLPQGSFIVSSVYDGYEGPALGLATRDCRHSFHM